MVESNSNNQFYTQYHTPRPTRIQTPRNNIIAYSIANKRRRDNKAKRKKEWNDVVRRVRASLNPTPVRTQRIKSTPRRVNTTQAPVNYNKIVKEAINESNAVKALLNLNRKPDANKEKAAFTPARDVEKKRKYAREYYHKKKETMTEAEKEAKRQYKSEQQRKRRASTTEAKKEKVTLTPAQKAQKEKNRYKEYYEKRKQSMTPEQKEAIKERGKARRQARTPEQKEAVREREKVYREKKKNVIKDYQKKYREKKKKEALKLKKKELEKKVQAARSIRLLAEFNRSIKQSKPLKVKIKVKKPKPGEKGNPIVLNN